MDYYSRTEPAPAERAFGEAVAAFVADAFGLPALRLLWVSPASEAVAAIDGVLDRIGRLTGDVVEASGVYVEGDIAGLSRREQAAADVPAVVIRTGLPPDLLVEAIAHEAAHVLQHREHAETLTTATLGTWEAWADRLAKATASAWRTTVGLNDPRFELFIKWHDEWRAR